MDTPNTPTPNSAGRPSAPTGSDSPPANGAPVAAGRSGANENPDEFSEFHDKERDARKAPDKAQDQPGHVEQNQDTAAVRAAQHADADEQRAAWSKDDPRYAGGGTHNTREEPADNPTTDE